MFDLEDDTALRRLCYFTAFLLVLIPLIQAAGASYPFGFGQVRWRLAATSNFVQAMHLPFLGLVMMVVIGRAVADKTMVRVVGIVGALSTIMMGIAIVLFLLDSLQLKSIVPTREMAAFNLAIYRIGLSSLIFLFAFAVLAFVALKSPKGQEKAPAKGSKRAAAEEPVGFLIGQDLSK